MSTRRTEAALRGRFLACTIAIVAGPAFAADEQVTVDLSSWDVDNDRMVSQQEWADVLEKHRYFDVVDANNNGVLDADEANDGLVEFDLSMDLDNGGDIDGTEFTRGVFDKHDTNDNDKLDDMEWMELIGNADGSPLFN